MEIAGLPLHPLTVHATVVLVPLSALLAIVLGVVPRWRWLTRWAAAATAVLATAATWLSTTSGEELAEATPRVAQGVAQAIEEHEEMGELLANSMIAFTVVVLLAAWSLAGSSPLASGRGAQDSRIGALEKVLPVVLVLGSIGVLVLVVLVGDSGARAVWG